MLLNFFTGSFFLVCSGVLFCNAHRNKSEHDLVLGIAAIIAGLYFIVAAIGSCKYLL